MEVVGLIIGLALVAWAFLWILKVVLGTGALAKDVYDAVKSRKRD